MQAASLPLLAPSPSSPLRQAVIHCEIVRQSARVVAMDRERLRCVLPAILPLCHSFLCSGWVGLSHAAPSLEAAGCHRFVQRFAADQPCLRLCCLAPTCLVWLPRPFAARATAHACVSASCSAPSISPPAPALCSGAHACQGLHTAVALACASRVQHHCCNPMTPPVALLFSKLPARPALPPPCREGRTKGIGMVVGTAMGSSPAVQHQQPQAQPQQAAIAAH